MNKISLKGVMQQFVERELPAVVRRDVSVPTDSGKIVSLIGARRTGKTFLMFHRNAFELDMCWDDGGSFTNAAWDMSAPETKTRELRAFSAGLDMWPEATGRLVYGSADHIPETHRPFAVEGWKYLLGLGPA